jgi:hypothetical protein
MGCFPAARLDCQTFKIRECQAHAYFCYFTSATFGSYPWQGNSQLLTWRAPAPFAALLPLVPAFQQYPLSLGNGVINKYPTSQVVDKKCQFKMDMFHNIS